LPSNDIKDVPLIKNVYYENLNVSQRDTKLFEPADLDINKSYSSIAILEPPTEKSKIETFQDNQKFFNPPLPSNNIPVVIRKHFII
jgi:hypothetical protein